MPPPHSIGRGRRSISTRWLLEYPPRRRHTVGVHFFGIEGRPILYILIAFLVSLAVAGAIVAFADSLSRLVRDRGDHAAVQASHAHEALRFGGVAILIGLFAGTAALSGAKDNLQCFFLLLSALPIIVAGVSEDSGRLVSAKYRFLVAMLSAGVAVWLLGVWVQRADLPGLDLVFQNAPAAIAISIFFAGGFCHAVNLIDGMNGLSAFVIMSAATGLGIVATGESLPELATLAYMLAAATLGFAIFNWPKSRLFLGDAGAYGLGHVLVWIAFSLAALSSNVSVPALLLILFWPLADTLHTVMRRFLSSMSLFQPDRMHLHQKVRRGLEITIFGRKRRRVSNPLTTLVLAPLILFPVSLGVMLAEHRLLAWIALLVCFGLFALAHVAAMALAQRLRKPGSTIGTLPSFMESQLDFWEALLLPARIHSDLSGIFIEDGMAVDVQIFRHVRQDVWFMEITAGNSAPWRWDRVFHRDSEAWEAFHTAVRRETLAGIARSNAA